MKAQIKATAVIISFFFIIALILYLTNKYETAFDFILASGITVFLITILTIAVVEIWKVLVYYFNKH